MLAVAVLRLVHLLRGLQLRERRDRGLADLDRAARLAAIRQPRIPVVVEVFNRVEAGEAPRHATHRTWAVGGGRWAVGGGRWAVGGGRGWPGLGRLRCEISRRVAVGEALRDCREAAAAYGMRT